jgi:predicted TIM-barrel fold metal-dependent hydrolase
MPDGACDCHVHIVGPHDKYAMDPNRTYTAGEASVEALRALRSELGISRNVLIQPSFYGTDNTCMLDALKELGASARGIAVLSPDVSDAELHEFDARGVKGVRVNLETKRGIRKIDRLCPTARSPRLAHPNLRCIAGDRRIG